MDTTYTIDFLQATLQVIYTIGEITAIIACLMLVNKNKSSATILMLVGATTSFITSICRTLLFALSSHLNNADSFDLILNGLFTTQAIAYGILILGLLLFAISYRKQSNN